MLQMAPLLCAGIIGFRSLRVADVKPGERVGLFGFGSSADALSRFFNHGTAKSMWRRGITLTESLGVCLAATWVGDDVTRPPVELDRAITFAPRGKVVIDALSCLRKGGAPAI